MCNAFTTWFGLSISQPCDGQESLKSVRDKAILLLGFFGAFRRSELVVLKRDYIQFALGICLLASTFVIFISYITNARGLMVIQIATKQIHAHTYRR